MLDAILAIVFGNSYMLWGLEYTPTAYQTLIKSISELPALILLVIKLIEGIVGFGLFLMANKMQKGDVN